MIRKVEELRPKLQINLFSNSKLLDGTEIPKEQAWSVVTQMRQTTESARFRMEEYLSGKRRLTVVRHASAVYRIDALGIYKIYVPVHVFRNAEQILYPPLIQCAVSPVIPGIDDAIV